MDFTLAEWPTSKCEADVLTRLGEAAVSFEALRVIRNMLAFVTAISVIKALMLPDIQQLL
jgi:hypothetical protein